MFKEPKKTKKLNSEPFDTKTLSIHFSEKIPKRTLPPTFTGKLTNDKEMKGIRYYNPPSLSSAKLSPGLNLTKTIKSISKERKNSLSNKTIYIPSLTDNFSKYNSQRSFNKDILAFPDTSKVRISKKEVGIIQAYAAVTNEGKRDYNEDRVSVIYSIPKPSNFIETPNNHWPKCSFFGLYDGHGGNGCSDFLRDNLHKFIIGDGHFPKNPQKAIVNGFMKAEKTFLKECESKSDMSGSCAIIVIILEKRCYVANVGDSRAILSGSNGVKTYALSKDHRPGDEKEYQRILQAGGKIYQTEYKNSLFEQGEAQSNLLIGPLRVFPGKLSVSRTIGDIEAKSEKYGGNPNVIISTPDIKYFDITDNFDFILIGCDGVFEKMKNKQIVDSIWNNINEKDFSDIHNLSGYVIEKTIEECLKRDSTDNLTIIMITLKDLNSMKSSNSAYYAAQTENIDEIKQSNPKNVYVAYTENIDPLKVKKGNTLSSCKKSKIQRQPLSVLLTKLVHNNTQNMKKVINCNINQK